MTRHYDPLEVAVGMVVEREHHRSVAQTRQTVYDHLEEYKNYYSRLAKVLPDVAREFAKLARKSRKGRY